MLLRLCLGLNWRRSTSTHNYLLVGLVGFFSLWAYTRACTRDVFEKALFLKKLGVSSKYLGVGYVSTSLILHRQM